MPTIAIRHAAKVLETLHLIFVPRER
jgi:hypothetical protein